MALQALRLKRDVEKTEVPAVTVLSLSSYIDKCFQEEIGRAHV
jgi:hypothetical protein